MQRPRMLQLGFRVAGLRLGGVLRTSILETGGRVPWSVGSTGAMVMVVTMVPPGPKVGAVKLLHTARESSGLLRVAALVAAAPHPAWRDRALVAARGCSTVAEVDTVTVLSSPSFFSP